jgi:hypothetical protein
VAQPGQKNSRHTHRVVDEVRRVGVARADVGELVLVDGELLLWVTGEVADPLRRNERSGSGPRRTARTGPRRATHRTAHPGG